MKKIVARYSCTMQVLYMICRLAWQLCRNNRADFAAFKAIYTETYIDEQLQAVKDAESIENEQRRGAAAKNLRLDARESALKVCRNWQSLKYYMGQAFATPKLENALLSAGAASYARAYFFNWGELQVLMNAGQSFIAGNTAELVAKGDMPAGFPARFAADAAICLEKWLGYATNKSDKSNIAIDKIAANNALYAVLTAMFTDAKQIYKSSPLQQQFLFTAFKVLAQGNGAGSVHGKVISALTGKAAGGVRIIIVNTNRHTTANSRGGYKFDRLAAGTYQIEFLKEDFEPVTLTVSVETSTAATVNVTLPPIIQVKVA